MKHSIIQTSNACHRTLTKQTLPKLGSSRLVILVFLLAFLSAEKSNAQFDLNAYDSTKIKAGPDEIDMKGGKIFNFADKNKVNFEVTVIGGASPGKYLIPEGSTLLDLILMSGSTAEEVIEDIRIVSLRTDSPVLKSRNVKEYDLASLYGTKKEVEEGIQNPLLKPGDLILMPSIKPVNPFGAFYYITQITYFLSSLISFYFLLDRLVNE